MVTNTQSQPYIPLGDDKFTRLDNRTKISIMSALMFGLDGTITEEQAVDHALSIDRLVGDKLRKIKDEKNRQRVQFQVQGEAR
jgi:hypothetical protein